MSSLQLSIPMPTQPAATTAEADDIYNAVVLLRRRGQHVYRAGRGMHSIGGRRVTDAILLSMASRPFDDGMWR